MKLVVAPDVDVAAPGDVLGLTVQVRNDHPDPVLPDLTVRGVGPEHVLRVDPGVELQPGQVGTARIEVRIPPDGLPGELPLAVEVSDVDGLVEPTLVVVDVAVGARPPVTIDVSPPSVRGRRTGTLDAVVRNDGPDPLSLALSGHGEDVEVGFDRDRVRLLPGGSQRFEVRISALERTWRRELRHGAVVRLRDDGAPASTTVTFVQRPFFPPLLLQSVAIVLLLSLWAGAAFAVNGWLQRDEVELATPDATGTTEDGTAGTDGGTEGSDGAAGGAGGAAGAEGGGGAGDDGAVVTASDTVTVLPVVLTGQVDGADDPLGSRIIVERVGFGEEGTTSDDDTKVAAQTATTVPLGAVVERIETETDDRGRFVVADGLSTSAFYRVSVVRPGYDVASTVVRTGPDPQEYEVTFTLVASPGAMSGIVTSTSGTPIGGAEVIVAGGELEYRTVTGSGSDAGRWSIEGIAAAPAYAITFRAPRFASATLVRSLASGEQLTDVDGRLAPGLGTVRGTTTYRAEGVGGLTVTLSGAGLERTTTTLTDPGVEGTFTLPALPYGTYQLVVTSDDWLPQTTEVVVDRGDVVVDLGDLRPATASVTGLVLQQVVGECEYPDPEDPAQLAQAYVRACGGVGVTLEGEGGTYRTTTATGDGTSAEAGTFTLTGIPPGAYTATLERFGYVPQHYLLELAAGDVVALSPQDEVGAAGVGPPALAAAVEPIVMLLLPPVDSATGTVRGVLRSTVDVDATFVPPAGTLLLVDAQDTELVQLEADGTFEITQLEAGAVEVRVLAQGYDEFTTVIRVAEQGTTEAGVLPLVPLGSLDLRVVDTVEFPIVGATVFVTGVDPEFVLDAASDPLVEACTVEKDAANRWRRTSTPSGGGLDGLCADARSDGTAVMLQALGTGTYRIIAPVNERDLADLSTYAGAPQDLRDLDPADRDVLAGTIPLDHQQLERVVDVRSGTTTRLDLRARRFAVITGQIQRSTGTGFTIVDDAGFVTGTGEDALRSFPALVDDVGIQLVETSGATPAPVGLEPRLAFGPADGLPEGIYRISRVLPDEVDTTRSYQLVFSNNDGESFRYEGPEELTNLGFGETRSAGAPLYANPVRVRVRVLDDSSGVPPDDPNALPITGAPVRASGVSGYKVSFGTLTPEITTSSGTTDQDGYAVLRRSGADQQYLEGQPITVTVDQLFGYDAKSITVDLPTRDATPVVNPISTVEIEVTPSRRTVTGRVVLGPTASDHAAQTTILSGLTLTLVHTGTGAETEVTGRTITSPTGAPPYLDFSQSEVIPGDYQLRMEGTGVLETTSGTFQVPLGNRGVPVAVTPPGGGSFIADRPVSLTVDLDEQFQLLADSVANPPVVTASGPAVGLDVALYADGDLVTPVVPTQETGTSGEVTFTGLRARSTISYRIGATGDGFLPFLDAAQDAFTLTSLTPPTEQRTVTPYGEVVLDVETSVQSGNSPPRRTAASGAVVWIDADASGTLDQGEVEATALTGPDAGRFRFERTHELTAGSYTLTIDADVLSTPITRTVQVVDSAEVTTTPEGDDVTGTDGVTSVTVRPSSVTITGTATDGDPQPTGLPRVVVRAFEGDAGTLVYDPQSTPVTTAVTAADGSFTLSFSPTSLSELVLELREYADDGTTVETTRPAVLRGITEAQLTSGRPIALGEVGMPEGLPAVSGVVRGYAVDPSVAAVTPTPLEGVTVTLTCDPNAVVDGGPNPCLSAAADPDPVDTVTGGSYSFGVVPEGCYTVSVDPVGYGPGTVGNVCIFKTGAAGSETVPTVTADVSVTAVRRAVTVATTSSAAGGVVPVTGGGVTVTVTASATVQTDTGDQTLVRTASVVAGAGGDGQGVFEGANALEPLTWTFTTSQSPGPALPQPHDDIVTGDAVTRPVPVGEDALAFTGAQALVMTRWGVYTGYVGTRRYDGDALALTNGVGVSLAIGGGKTRTTLVGGTGGSATSGTSGAEGEDGMWRVWVQGTQTTSFTVTLTLTGYVTVTSDGRLANGADALAQTTDSLVAVPQAVTVPVRAADEPSRGLAGVTVTATTAAAGLSDPVAVVTDANGDAVFDGRDALEPVTWTFTTTRADEQTPPYVDGADDGDVQVGDGTPTGTVLETGSDPAVPLVLELEREALGGAAVSYTGGVDTRVAGVTVTATRASDGTVVTSAPSTTATGPEGNYALVLGDGTWRLEASTASVSGLLVDPAFVVDATVTALPEAVVPSDPGADLSGTVTASGVPVEGATVTATAGSQVRLAETAADGSYTLVGLDAGVTFAVRFDPPPSVTGVPVTRYVAPGGATTPIDLGQAIPTSYGSIRVDVTGGTPGATVAVHLDEAGPFRTVDASGRTSSDLVLDAAGAGSVSFTDLVPGDDTSVPNDRFTVTVVAAGFLDGTAGGVEVFPAAQTVVAVDLAPTPAPTRDVVLTLTDPDGDVRAPGAVLRRDGATITATVPDASNVHTFADVPSGATWELVVAGYEAEDVVVPSGTADLTASIELVPTVPVEITFTDGGTAVTSIEPPPTLTLGGTTVEGTPPTAPAEAWSFGALRAGTWTVAVDGYDPTTVDVTLADPTFTATVALTAAGQRSVALTLTDPDGDVDGATVTLRRGASTITGTAGSGGNANVYTFTGVASSTTWVLTVPGYETVDVVVPAGTALYEDDIALVPGAAVSVEFTIDGTPLTSADPAPTLTLGSIVVSGTPPVAPATAWTFGTLRGGSWTAEVSAYAPETVVVPAAPTFATSVALTPAPRDVVLTLTDPDGAVADVDAVLQRSGTVVPGTAPAASNEYTFPAVAAGQTWVLLVDGYEAANVTVPVGTGDHSQGVVLVPTGPVSVTFTVDGVPVTALDPAPTLALGGRVVRGTAPVDPSTAWTFGSLRAGAWTVAVTGYTVSPQTVVVPAGSAPVTATVVLTPAPRDVALALEDAGGAPLSPASVVLRRSGHADVPGTQDAGTPGTYRFPAVVPGTWSVVATGHDPADVDVTVGVGEFTGTVVLTPTA